MADQPKQVQTPARDSRTEYQKSADCARYWGERIITAGVEECHPQIALEVRLADARFAQYVDMMEHIKAEFYTYVRDRYGNKQ